MDILHSLFIIVVIILFPMFSYFIFVSDMNHENNKTSKIIFDLALFTSLYLLFKCDCSIVSIKVMFLTVPLLIAYLKNRKMLAIIISVCIGFYYLYPIGINPVYVVIEFILYYVVIHLMKKDRASDINIISLFAIVKIIFTFFELRLLVINNYNIINEIIILPFAFYFTIYLIWYCLESTEKIMRVHMTVKELEKQKQLQDSLFKITHEIKNPIAVCKGYLDMIDTSNQSQVKRYIPIVKQEIERTLTLMDDFMMLTKINISTSKMDVSVLLQDVCDTISLMLRNGNIKFLPTIIDQEIYIEGDYDRLKQVFLNFAKNAIEAIPNTGKGIIKLEVQVNKSELLVIIEDNGVGMTKQILNRIGEAFYTTKKNGTGLGIKFSKEIIDAHNGKVEYKSIPNKGTTITVKLPIKKSLK